MEPLSDDTQKMDRHNAFLRRLYGSSFGVFVVAAWMHRLKRTVKIYPIDAAPFGEDPNKYVDKGDLLVTDEKGENSLLEVKHIQTSFTCQEDWPHPFVIVSNVGSVDRNRGSVKAYVILNKEATHVAIIPASDIDSWEKRDIMSSNTQKVEAFYTCKPSSCVFKFIGDYR